MLTFEDLLHPLVRKLFLLLKEALLHLNSENQCWTCQFLVASEIQVVIEAKKGIDHVKNMWLKLGQN